MRLVTIAIIAHVDHGKTTLLDGVLKQTHTFRDNQEMGVQIMDTNPQERERGITILAKNASVHYGDVKVNIVDTPGHADFSSEVERVLKMVDGALLLVDAKEGPMPQTKFVLRKALALGLKPIVVVNKIDKPDARPDHVIDATFDLFVELGATHEQLDFPIVYTIAKAGVATRDLAVPGTDLRPLLDLIVSHVQSPPDTSDQLLQAQVYNLDHDNFIGAIALARIFRGSVKPGQKVRLVGVGRDLSATVGKVFTYEGLSRAEVASAPTGDLVAISGLADELKVGETIADAVAPEPLEPLAIDEPTLTMRFSVNDSPFAGKEGKFVTTRHVRERLLREVKTNVGLKISELSDSDDIEVAGRGELHLAVLIENMRREGFELQVSKPEVIMKEVDGVKMEPIEELVLEVPQGAVGTVMEKLGARKGQLTHMHTLEGHSQMEFIIPTRSLLGFRSEFIVDTRGAGIMYHGFHGYAPVTSEENTRRNGVLISAETGTTTGFALNLLQERGELFLPPAVDIYEGQIVGEHSRGNDLTVNPTKEKQLSNMRASGKDDAIRLAPPRGLTLEQALEYVSDDELVEVTPTSIRLRKRWLKEVERRRNGPRKD